jgi:hypothetical protein
MAKHLGRNISTFLDYSIKQHDPPPRTEGVKDSYLFSAQLEEPITERFGTRFTQAVSPDSKQADECVSLVVCAVAAERTYEVLNPTAMKLQDLWLHC